MGGCKHSDRQLDTADKRGWNMDRRATGKRDLEPSFIGIAFNGYIMRLGLGLGLTRSGGYSDPNLAFTKLLMGMEGADGSTAFVDESPLARSGMGFANQAQIDTAQFKFGSSSLLLDGVDDNVSWTESPDWHFGTGEMTVEAWFRPVAVTGVRWLFGQAETLTNAVANSWILWMFNGIPRFSYVPTGSSVWVDAAVATSALALNTQTHVGFDRASDGTCRIYVGGVMEGSGTFSGDFKDVNQFLMIGASFTNTDEYSGHIDELRILKGKAAWASNGGFTPPSTAYARR
jgi:hypothetical protein